MEKRYEVLCQQWTETELGWGTRPDGFTLHMTEQHRAQYIRQYWAGMPDRVPDEYSRPDGEPYHCEVDEATYARMQAEGGTIWGAGNNYPRRSVLQM